MLHLFKLGERGGGRSIQGVDPANLAAQNASYDGNNRCNHCCRREHNPRRCSPQEALAKDNQRYKKNCRTEAANDPLA
jgi:hypothetical protein